jgi:hypothetical protein
MGTWVEMDPDLIMRAAVAAALRQPVAMAAVREGMEVMDCQIPIRGF